MNSLRDLHDAVVEGAVQRVRPKIMTVCAILFGLLPIMWSPVTQAGADVMKRIATPMIGGVISSAVLNLLIYPVLYVIWRRRELPERAEEETATFIPPALVPSRVNRQRLLKWIAVIIGVVAIFYAGNFAWQKLRPAEGSGAPPRVRRVRARGPVAAEVLAPLVRDALRTKGRRQRLAAEVREAPRRRPSTHVHDALDPVRLEKRDEHLRRPRRMPDRVHHARCQALRRHGSYTTARDDVAPVT